MALTPDTGETFLREVDENLRRDQLRTMARKYAPLWIAAVVLLLAAVGGWLYWQDKQKKDAAEDSEAAGPGLYRHRRRQAGDGAAAARCAGRGAAPTRSAHRPCSPAPRWRSSRTTARWRSPNITRSRTTKGLPAPYRDLGLIRATTLEFDGLKPDQVIARMEPIAKPGNPWFGSAGELTAMAMIKQGKKLEAGRLFAAVAADQAGARIHSRPSGADRRHLGCRRERFAPRARPIGMKTTMNRTKTRSPC